MRTRYFALLASTALLSLPYTGAARADFFFSTGSVDGRIATASRPGPASGANQETETGDDFILTQPTKLNSATFIGLLPSDLPLSSVSQVIVEIYRVFPKDSTVPPPDTVPTRVNSPSDVEFVGRDSAVSGELTYSTTLLDASFSVPNSVDTGIHPKPGNLTGGDGSASGQEVQFNITFEDPITLPQDHYFFVPQVLLSDPDQHFLWLSSVRPIVSPGTPFAPDLQSWIRNAQLDPNWLRIGTDIVGGTTFNAAFTLNGVFVPEPGTLSILGFALPAFLIGRKRRTNRIKAA